MSLGTFIQRRKKLWKWWLNALLCLAQDKEANNKLVLKFHHLSILQMWILFLSSCMPFVLMNLNVSQLQEKSFKIKKERYIYSKIKELFHNFHTFYLKFIGRFRQSYCWLVIVKIDIIVGYRHLDQMSWCTNYHSIASTHAWGK